METLYDTQPLETRPAPDLMRRFGPGPVADLLGLLDPLLAALVEDKGDDLQRLRLSAHALVGSAGSLGFAEAGAAAQTLQQAILTNDDIEAAHRTAVAACTAARRTLATQLAALA